MQAGAVGRRVRRYLVFGLRDPAGEPVARQLGVERLLLVLHLPVAFGDSGKLVAKTLHGAADRRSLRVLHRIAGIEPALGNGEGDDADHWLFPAQLALNKRARGAGDHGTAGRTLAVRVRGFCRIDFLEKSWSSGAAWVGQWTSSAARPRRGAAATATGPFSPFNGEKVPEGG